MSELKILLSRTDSIGDVILTLPMAGLIKAKYPHCKVVFLGKAYTKEVISCSQYVDQFMDWDSIQKLDYQGQVNVFKAENIDVFIHVFPNAKIAKLAFKAGIKIRIGTAHRVFHHIYCNTRHTFSRKKSELHEAQLNIKLLKSLNIYHDNDAQNLQQYYGFNQIAPLENHWNSLLLKGSANIILHPKSKGSAREWGLNNFKILIELCLAKGIRIFLTGTEEEGQLFRDELVINHPNLIDLSGKMSLAQLISFIAKADALVAASTGPLHIAAATGTLAIGIFPPIKPMHPGRWAPIGLKTKVFVLDKPKCSECRNGESCVCMQKIDAEEVAKSIFLDLYLLIKA